MKEERARGLMGCGEDCLNRMLMIECGSRCPLGEHCSNKRFQKVCCHIFQLFRDSDFFIYFFSETIHEIDSVQNRKERLGSDDT